MKYIDALEAFAVFCKTENKYGMYFSFATADYGEIEKAAPWLLEFQKQGNNRPLFEGEGMLLFDTKEELDKVYDQTVGDDGPTASNPYNGPGRVYALTIYPDGESHNENT